MSLSVKDASGATQTINTLPALGQTNAAGSLPAALALDGNHAKSTDIGDLKSGIVGALTPLGGLPMSISGVVAVSQSGAWNVGLAPGATVALAGGNTVAIKVDGSAVTQPVSGTVTVGALPALPAGSAKIGSVDVAGTVTVGGTVAVSNLPATQAVSGPVTDAQLRASAVPVSGPVTDAQLRASAVPVSGPVTDAQLRASAVPVSGPVTDAQLRASAVPVSIAAVTKVGGNTVRAFASFVRPANTTPYAAGQLVANATAAASVTPIALAVARVNGGTCAIPTLKLSKTSTTTSKASFRVHLYRNAPTASNGDGGVWLTTSSIYLGFADVTMDKVFTDEVSGTGVIKDAAGNPRTLLTDTAAGSQNIYALIEARDAYAPASGETFTLTAEVAQD